MRLRALLANLGVVLMAVGAMSAIHLLRALGPECG